MPTAKPRIQITLEAEQYEVLSRLATLQRRPMARIVAELVGEMTPILGKVVRTMEAAQAAQESVKLKIRRAVDDAEAVILPHAQSLLERYEQFGDEIGAIANQIEGTRPRRGAGTGRVSGTEPRHGAREAPDPVTTGATNRKTKGTKANRGV